MLYGDDDGDDNVADWKEPRAESLHKKSNKNSYRQHDPIARKNNNNNKIQLKYILYVQIRHNIHLNVC